MRDFVRRLGTALLGFSLLLGAGLAGASSISLTSIDQTLTQYRESDDNNSGTFGQMNGSGTGTRNDCISDSCSLTVNAVTGTLTDSVVGSGTAQVDITISAQTFADSANVALTGGQYVEGNVLLDFDISLVTDNPGDTWTLDATSLVFSGSLIAVLGSGADDADDGSQAEALNATADINGTIFNFNDAALTAGDGGYPGTENFLDSANSAALVAGTGSQVIPVSVSYNLSSYSAQDDSFFGIDGDLLTANGDWEGTFSVTFAAAPEPSTGLLAGLSLVAACFLGRAERGRARRG